MIPEFATEGMLWFPNLLVADTTMILPISLALFNLFNCEVFTILTNMIIVNVLIQFSGPPGNINIFCSTLLYAIKC